MTWVATWLEKALPDNSKGQWQRAEFWAAMLITLWLVALHVFNLFHAGPLWRDEADTAEFASMPTMGDIWHNLRNDISPPLFTAVARVWTLAGLNSDFNYRVLGFLVGTGTLGLLWWCTRKLGAKMPLLILALYAINPIAIRVGDSLRPYGLGIALNWLTLTLIWVFVQIPGRRAFFLAALAAVLSVQCLYQNAFFILSFCCAAWVVTLCRREWKIALQIGIIGLAAALSMMPYWSIITKGQMSLGIRGGEIHFDTIWNMLCDALQTSGGWVVTLLWLALYAIGLVVTVVYGTRQRRWVMLYCGTVMVLSAPLFLGFLRGLGLRPSLWYFLILMAPTALMVDSILGGLDMWRLQIGRAVVSLIVVASCIPACYAGVCLRQTNIDLVAAKLKEAARPGDLILIAPWYYGVSLHRYLDASRWITLPPLEDVSVHRYDLVKKAMMTKNPMGPLLDKMQATLRSGHGFWLVGSLADLPDRNPPPVLPPYKGGVDQTEGLYLYSWMFQLTYFLERHAIEAHRVEIPVPGGLEVNPLENLPLQVVHGWRE